MIIDQSQLRTESNPEIQESCHTLSLLLGTPLVVGPLSGGGGSGGHTG